MFNRYWQRFLAILRHSARYVFVFLKTFIFAGACGVLCGFAGLFFHISVEYATEMRETFPWLLFLLPLAGIIIVFLYKKFSAKDDEGTDTVVEYAGRAGKEVPVSMAPLIFISTVLTHLCGGSAGREGAALQLGGSIGSRIGNILRADRYEMRIFIMCGMSALFSALFGTPIAAVFLAVEVSFVGNMMYSALLPCMISSFSAYAVVNLFGIAPTAFVIPNIPAITLWNMAAVAALAALCAVLSIIFCGSLKYGSKLMHKIKNDYLRAVLGGATIIALTFITGTRDYNGAGMNIVENAVSGGKIVPYAFALKIIFTAITLESGYKGGEIVPTLFIGATFGSFMGGILGMNTGFGAAIGIAALFCGVLNCPVTSIFFAAELFGSDSLIFFVPAVIISYMLSGYHGLYSAQKIVYSKLRPRQIKKTSGK